MTYSKIRETEESDMLLGSNSKLYSRFDNQNISEINNAISQRRDQSLSKISADYSQSNIEKNETPRKIENGNSLSKNIDLKSPRLGAKKDPNGTENKAYDLSISESLKNVVEKYKTPQKTEDDNSLTKNNDFTDHFTTFHAIIRYMVCGHFSFAL